VRARAVAIYLGAFYALLTALELVFGGWTLGGATLLERTTKSNLLHWILALAMLGGYFGGQRVARLVCRIAGPILLVLAIWGLISARSLGDVFGYGDGVPVAYGVLGLLTAAAAIVAGYAGRPKAA
jgi:hypothetical protein